jgi:hypothetical protein
VTLPIKEQLKRKEAQFQEALRVLREYKRLADLAELPESWELSQACHKLLKPIFDAEFEARWRKGMKEEAQP